MVRALSAMARVIACRIHQVLGDRDDQPEVRLDEAPLGRAARLERLLELAPALGCQALLAAGVAEGRLGLVARLDGLGQVDLVHVGQQRVLPDLTQVLPDQVLVRSLLPGLRAVGLVLHVILFSLHS